MVSELVLEDTEVRKRSDGNDSYICEYSCKSEKNRPLVDSSLVGIYLVQLLVKRPVLTVFDYSPQPYRISYKLESTHEAMSYTSNN